MPSLAEQVFGQLSFNQVESVTIRPSKNSPNGEISSWLITRRYTRESKVPGVPGDSREYTRPIDEDVLPTILGLIKTRVMAVDATSMDVTVEP